MAQRKIQGSDWLNAVNTNFDELYLSFLKRGKHTVTAGQATANTLDITTGLTTATAFIVQIWRSGVMVMSDAAVSMTSGVITVADGASTYSVTEGDVINWIVF